MIFDNPHVERLEVSIPFASRGVMASMNEEMLAQFQEEHIAFLQKMPVQFEVKHEVYFITYYM